MKTRAGCPAPAGAPRALGVVRGGRRHVAQPDDVELADVDAELHRGRAVQDRQARLAERLLALLALLGPDLRGVLLGADPDAVARHLAVEADEVRVDAAGPSRARLGTRIGSWKAAVPSPACQRIDAEASWYPGSGAGFLGLVHDEQEPRDLEDLAQLADDELAVLDRERLPVSARTPGRATNWPRPPSGLR